MLARTYGREHKVESIRFQPNKEAIRAEVALRNGNFPCYFHSSRALRHALNLPSCYEALSELAHLLPLLFLLQF